MYGLFLLLLLYYTLLYPTSSPKKKISNRNFIVCTRPKVGPSVRRSSLFRVPATLLVFWSISPSVRRSISLSVQRSICPSVHPLVDPYTLHPSTENSNWILHRMQATLKITLSVRQSCILSRLRDYALVHRSDGLSATGPPVHLLVALSARKQIRQVLQRRYCELYEGYCHQSIFNSALL